jgi:hypothetical protein
MEAELNQLVAAYNAASGQGLEFVLIHRDLGYLGNRGRVWATVRPYSSSYVLDEWRDNPEGFAEWWNQRL